MNPINGYLKRRGSSRLVLDTKEGEEVGEKGEGAIRGSEKEVLIVEITGSFNFNLTRPGKPYPQNM